MITWWQTARYGENMVFSVHVKSQNPYFALFPWFTKSILYIFRKGPANSENINRSTIWLMFCWVLLRLVNLIKIGNNVHLSEQLFNWIEFKFKLWCVFFDIFLYFCIFTSCNTLLIFVICLLLISGMWLRLIWLQIAVYDR